MRAEVDKPNAPSREDFVNRIAAVWVSTRLYPPMGSNRGSAAADLRKYGSVDSSVGSESAVAANASARPDCGGGISF